MYIIFGAVNVQDKYIFNTKKKIGINIKIFRKVNYNLFTWSKLLYFTLYLF